MERSDRNWRSGHHSGFGFSWVRFHFSGARALIAVLSNPIARIEDPHHQPAGGVLGRGRSGALSPRGLHGRPAETIRSDGRMGGWEREKRAEPGAEKAQGGCLGPQ